jgi:multidrug transporter EmrE-like cation transporter
VWSRIFFGEPFSARKIGGLALIIGGIILLNFGNR